MSLDAVTILTDDLLKLEPGCWLNDSLIDFDVSACAGMFCQRDTKFLPFLSDRRPFPADRDSEIPFLLMVIPMCEPAGAA